MILGLSLSAFTSLHVILSLIGILTGVVVVLGMLTAKPLPGWTAVFLASTILTSATGFLFPFSGLLPSHVVGIISLGVLVIAVLALYLFRLEGIWRWVYIVSAVLALYFNVFVGIVQAFQKLSFLQPLAPTQSEPPFVVAQSAVLLLFLVLAVMALRSFHPAARVPAS
jgi:hypothetical protein